MQRAHVVLILVLIVMTIMAVAKYPLSRHTYRANNDMTLEEVQSEIQRLTSQITSPDTPRATVQILMQQREDLVNQLPSPPETPQTHQNRQKNPQFQGGCRPIPSDELCLNDEDFDGFAFDYEGGKVLQVSSGHCLTHKDYNNLVIPKKNPWFGDSLNCDEYVQNTPMAQGVPDPWDSYFLNHSDAILDAIFVLERLAPEVVDSPDPEFTINRSLTRRRAYWTVDNRIGHLVSPHDAESINSVFHILTRDAYWYITRDFYENGIRQFVLCLVELQDNMDIVISVHVVNPHQYFLDAYASLNRFYSTI